jgi:hypothetical protein
VIDGTHVDAVVPVDKSVRYRGRKGNTTQNVMAACDFDMLFTFFFYGMGMFSTRHTYLL